MNLIVKKFGGTSLANNKLMKNAALRIKDEISQGNKVIVVVSAMAKATNNLIAMANKASNNIESIDINSEIDAIISTGEQVSAGLMAINLNRIGLKSKSFLGWQIKLLTNDNYQNAEIISVDSEILHSMLKNDIIPVVSGFQGVDSSNRITTLGRGGSDLTAVYLSYAMNAKRCDIYTDVDGVYTQDPRKASSFEKIQKINYDKMYEMSDAGSKVMQKESVAIAKKYKVPVKVLSSFSLNQSPSLIIEKDLSE